ncbi:hypothetical protein [Candidatus Palauibacter sp.]|uniref:hypothetical protein n=1 Tax=Candidatus Palauibacter sp. TaxID=3101350 RepID=UPI003AF272A4
MTDPDASIPREIRRLVEESQEILGWLDRLADLARDTRPEIVARIRRDYDGRLHAADERLAGHRPRLVEIVAEREDGLGALRHEMGARAADLEEIGLRHEIGEFDESELKARRAPVERALATLEAHIEREKETIATLTGVIKRLGTYGLESIGSIESIESIESAAEPPPGEVPVSAPEPEVAVIPEPETPADDNGRQSDYGDELDFLESLSFGESAGFDAVSAMLEEEEETAGDEPG